MYIYGKLIMLFLVQTKDDRVMHIICFIIEGRIPYVQWNNMENLETIMSFSS